MPLTPENLASIEGLTPEQVQQIATLSAGVEALAVKDATAAATRAAYTAVDQAIQTATGKEKPGGVKTSDHLAAELSRLASAGQSDNAKALKAKVDELEKKLAAAGKDASAEATAQIEKLQRQLSAAQAKFDADLTAAVERAQQAEQANEDFRINAYLDNQFSGLTFRDDIPQHLVDLAKRAAYDKIKGLDREWVDTGDGGQRPIFKQDGITVRNDKQLEASPLDLAAPFLKGVTVDVPKVAGTGTNKPGTPPAAQPSAGGFQLNGYATQVDATRGLVGHLKSKGLQQGTDAFQAEFDKISKEVIIPAGLPLRDAAAV